MRVGSNAWSMQYHVEVEADTVANWGEVPAYREALESTLGPDGLSNMKSGADRHLLEFLSCAETLYRNFMNHVNPDP
jgi:hypothetical protein